MIRILSTLVILLFTMQTWATPTPEQPDRNVEFYLLDDGVGLSGYDPVSYFTEHGGIANKGNTKIALEYGDVTYYFSSEENREIFKTAPTKYEPTYGGWCAWAMANEGYAEIDPMLYTQNGDRMHFFISRNAKSNFDEMLKFHEGNADEFWMEESGEKARK